MEKILISFNTAFNVNNVFSMPVTKGDLRNEQYFSGFTSFFDKNNITSLRNLKFDINNASKIELVDEPEIDGGLREGVVKK